MAVLIVDVNDLTEPLGQHQPYLKTMGVEPILIVNMVAKAWVEALSPKYYPARAGAQEILSLIVEDELNEEQKDLRQLEYIYDLAQEVYFILDERASRLLNYSAVVDADYAGFHGRDGVMIRFQGNRVFRR